tara:strand:+ start:9049 stop:9915 length:867 start_codon:yes stop_codon:yes gene_type:complete
VEVDIIRLLFVFLGGYFLCLSGSLSQLITNNGIASPSTLGMDGMAVLTIIIAQFAVKMFGFDVSLGTLSFLLFSAFIGILYFATRKTKNAEGNVWQFMEMKKVIILGLAFNLFVGAIFSVIQFLFMSLNFDFPTGIWFGNFKQFQTYWIIFYLVGLFCCAGFVFKHAHQLSLLNLGKSFALGRGTDLTEIQRRSLFLSLFLTGLVICFFGVFSFLGLIFPHILRSMKIFRSHMQWEIFYGPIIAGVILMVFDTFCYNFTFYGAELPVGMTSSIIGAFFLIILVLRQKV